MRRIAKTLNPEAAPLGQMVMPMITGILRTKQSLFGFVQEAGLLALLEIFNQDTEKMAGKKGRWNKQRGAFRWGMTQTALPFAGRNVTVPRPRLRSLDGREMELPSVKAFQHADPLAEKVMEQILAGVSCRSYSRSLTPPPAGAKSRGASRSSASRQLVESTRAKLADFMTGPLADVDLAVLMLDGIHLGDHLVVAALGITAKGDKVPLGLWQGSTENATVCKSLLQSLLERGLKIDGRRLLCVIDGGKGLRRALDEVLGDLALIQRCQLHKLRNVMSHLPEKRHAFARRTMIEAYHMTRASDARSKLVALAKWLERQGEVSAAASLREGLEETLTVLKLNLPALLLRSLSSTNAIESLMSTIRRVTRNVKRWRGGEMALRWCAAGMQEAARRFHRLKGHRHIPLLLSALRLESVEPQSKIA